MESNDPELPRVLIDERKTVDLCGEEHAGARCVRERGHEGQHEAVVWTRPDPLRWG